MQIALLTDIHANREAFEACLAHARCLGATRFVILGDIVGYGADPEFCTDTCMEMAQSGAIVIRGNHDQAVIDIAPSMTSNARLAIDWTKAQLSPAQKQFLGNLPLTHMEEDRLYVHADASAPARWNYVTDGQEAENHILSTPAKVSFCGHVHRPALYSYSERGNKLTAFTPNSDGAIPLMSQRHWLGVIGSVGQPRDGNPLAAWGLYDTATRNLRYLRTTYDIKTAQMKIRMAGLPDTLAERLARGI